MVLKWVKVWHGHQTASVCNGTMKGKQHQEPVLLSYNQIQAITVLGYYPVLLSYNHCEN